MEEIGEDDDGPVSDNVPVFIPPKHIAITSTATAPTSNANSAEKSSAMSGPAEQLTNFEQPSQAGKLSEDDRVEVEAYLKDSTASEDAAALDRGEPTAALDPAAALMELQYHPGKYCDILNPAYMRYVNVNLRGMRFLGGLRSLLYIGEDEPPRRIIAWACCADTSRNAPGCKIRKSKAEPMRIHSGVFSCFCHECKYEINGFEMSRCNQPCGPKVGRSPNTYSMIHKNWEKNDDEIEFVYMQTMHSVFSRTPAGKKSEGIRNWFEWTCCGHAQRGQDGCLPIYSEDPRAYVDFLSVGGGSRSSSK